MRSHDSNDVKTATSKMLHQGSPRVNESILGAREQLSLDEEGAESVEWENQDPLVKFGVDMTELSDYLDNLTRVVNQHAKLLDKVSEELDERPKKLEVGEMFNALSLAYPYERSLRQMALNQHPPRGIRVCEILSDQKVSLTSRLENQLVQPVTNMWEGMERFMKAVDVVGRTCVELKEFQHSSEIQFDHVNSKLNDCVYKTEHEISLMNLRDIVDSKMNSAFTDFQEQINKLSRKTDKRLVTFDEDLKKLECDTVWKIKDYEKLLEARPTLTFVRQAITEESREILMKSKVYTDDEISTLRMSSVALERKFQGFMLAINGDVRDLQSHLRGFGERLH